MELTDKDFQCFKDEANHWIRFFGLLDWRVDYSFEKLNGCYAEIRSNFQGKCATIALDRFPEEELSTDQIRKSAFHEVCELLLRELCNVALNDEIPYEEREKLTEIAAHGVIRRLENTVFE